MADSTQLPASNPDPNQVDELDATIEGELNTDTSASATQQPDAMNLDGANDTAGPSGAAANGVPAEAPFEARIAAKKDVTLREFLGKMDEYAPVVRTRPSVAQLRRELGLEE